MAVFMIFLMATLIVPRHLKHRAEVGGLEPRKARTHTRTCLIDVPALAREGVVLMAIADSGQAVLVINVERKKWYFEADIAGPDGKLIDKVIIDRRTGRIRSIY
jgi:hypothetical protein